MPDVHAYLGASSSSRWLHCPGSAKLNAAVPNESSTFAQEGTDAHSLCAYFLLTGLGQSAEDPTENLTYYDQTMKEAAEGYATFVLEQVEEIKKTCPDPLVRVEQRLDFGKWVPGGFGTGDAVIVADGIIHIIDMKYGVGVLVSAAGEDGEGNTQLKLYALGAYDTYGCLFDDIQTIRLTIYQPRRGNIDTFELTSADLLDWAENELKPRAEEAYAGIGGLCAGPWCKFCRVKGNCRKREEENMKIAQEEFREPPLLSDDEIAEILPKIDDLVSWADDVKKYALDRALQGNQINGYKVVAGRATRKYRDEALAAKIVSDAGFDPYEHKVLGITAMEKELGKVKFNELLGGQIVKPQGKPVLVPESDKRPEFNSAVNDFADNDWKGNDYA